MPNTMFKLYFLHFLSDLDVLRLVRKLKVVRKIVRYSPRIADLLYAGNIGLVFYPRITGLLYAGDFGLVFYLHITGLLYAGKIGLVFHPC